MNYLTKQSIMKNKEGLSFSLDIILVEDPSIGGFTAYFKQFPNIISEGETEDLAIHNLMCAVHDVFNYKGRSRGAKHTKPSCKVIRKSFEFRSPNFV
jgi:hypothetical protein